MGTEKRGQKKKKTSIRAWVLTVFILSFVLSMFMSWSSQAALAGAGIAVATVVVVLLILLGIVMDMIGMAVASSDQGPFVAMAAKKVKGAKKALWLSKNADKVSSVCNDVAGDICGIVSGSAGTVLTLRIVELTAGSDSFWVGILISSIIAALTVGGKAVCKRLAIVKSKDIVFLVGRVLSVFSRS